jgi:hypothetical protein
VSPCAHTGAGWQSTFIVPRPRKDARCRRAERATSVPASSRRAVSGAAVANARGRAARRRRHLESRGADVIAVAAAWNDRHATPWQANRIEARPVCALHCYSSGRPARDSEQGQALFTNRHGRALRTDQLRLTDKHFTPRTEPVYTHGPFCNRLSRLVRTARLVETVRRRGCIAARSFSSGPRLSH